MDQTTMADESSELKKSHPEEEAKAPNLIEKGKEEIKATIGSEKSPKHDKETHGTSNDINEDTPIDKVKGPGVLERAKEEIEAVGEAIIEVIHPKK